MTTLNRTLAQRLIYLASITLRYRYLLPEEEPRLMAQLDGPRAHLRPAVIVALGTGMRMTEQLQMKRPQADFLRNIVTARDTTGDHAIFR